MDLPRQLTFTGMPEINLKGPPKSKEEQVQRAAVFKAGLRRRTQLARAADVLPCLPGPGESVHALMTGYFDFMLVLTCVLQSRPETCDHLRIATLAFSQRNVTELCRLLDSGKVKRVSLVCSDYMAKASAAIYQGGVGQLVTERSQSLRSARSHCKVVCMALEDGTRYVFEGSANLRTNRNIEQLTVFNDPGLHDWHARWIDAGCKRDQAEEEKARQG